jgi:hypothetical protein
MSHGGASDRSQFLVHSIFLGRDIPCVSARSHVFHAEASNRQGLHDLVLPATE